MASTTLTWYGHATFGVQHKEHRLLIDPFFTDNPSAKTRADDMEPTVILVTHGHGDHIGDTIEIAKRTNALVIANFEIVTWLQGQGISNAHPMHIGGARSFEFGTVKLTIAHHGSALPDGSNGGHPAGLLLTIAGKTLYFAGDTGLFYDMKLIGEVGLDIAVLPIGDNFTMGPDDAVRAAQFLNPKVAIPHHYNTWPLIQQDANAWAERVTAETSATGRVLNVDEALDLDTLFA